MIMKLEACWQHICVLLAMLFLLSSFQLELSEAAGNNEPSSLFVNEETGNNGIRKRLDSIITSSKRRGPSSPPSPLRNTGHHARSSPLYPPLVPEPSEPSQPPVPPLSLAKSQQEVSSP